MKEHEVKGLEQLKAEYDARLAKLPDYEKLSKEFHDKALELVQEAIKTAGIKPEQTELATKGGPGPLMAKSCGFCKTCISDCAGCVAYA